MKFAIIGCGNMSSALMNKVAMAYPGASFLTYSPSGITAKKLAESINGHSVENISDLCDCDFYLIGCKPQQAPELARNCDGILKNKKVISILAGTSIETLKKLFETDMVMRLMPNTPSLLGLGTILSCHSDEFSSDDKELMQKMFSHCGEFVQLKNEIELDELTVFSGSGPAYIFQLAKIYQQEIMKLGYDEAFSRTLIDQLFVGSSRLMQHEQSMTYTEQIEKVTSKAGVTIEAIEVLRQSSLEDIIHESLKAALIRTVELRDGRGE